MNQQQIIIENLSKEELLNLFVETQNQNEEFRNKISTLEDQLCLFTRLIYGKKSERHTNKGIPAPIQNSLFDLDPVVETPQEPEVQKIKAHNRVKPPQKKHNGRNPWPNHLPINEVVLDIENKEEDYIECASEITEILEFSPALAYVLRTIRKKYFDPKTNQFVISQLPPRPVEKCSLGTTVIVDATVAKFVDHMPTHRYCEKIKRDHKIDIPRSTLGESIHQHLALLKPLYELFVQQIIEANYIQVDETTIKVQSPEIKGKCHTGYLYGCRNPVHDTVFFSYQHTRSQVNTMAHLQGFKGKLQSDGHNVYEMYDDHPDFEHFACWAHARRKFYQALDSDKVRANKIMLLIRILYDVEEESRLDYLNYEQRLQLRLQKSQPILIQIKQLLDEFSLQSIHPDSRMGKAIAYTLKRWDNLIRYIHNGEVEIDNNLTENSIRPIALGRKNYLFAGSPDAAQNAAMMYSFFGTCKLHKIDPYDWLIDVLNKIATYPINQIEDLLPQTWAKSNS